LLASAALQGARRGGNSHRRGAQPPAPTQSSTSQPAGWVPAQKKTTAMQLLLPGARRVARAPGAQRRAGPGTHTSHTKTRTQTHASNRCAPTTRSSAAMYIDPNASRIVGADERWPCLAASLGARTSKGHICCGSPPLQRARTRCQRSLRPCSQLRPAGTTNHAAEILLPLLPALGPICCIIPKKASPLTC
jgi:hypothetical protein